MREDKKIFLKKTQCQTKIQISLSQGFKVVSCTHVTYFLRKGGRQYRSNRHTGLTPVTVYLPSTCTSTVLYRISSPSGKNKGTKRQMDGQTHVPCPDSTDVGRTWWYTLDVQVLLDHVILLSVPRTRDCSTSVVRSRPG